MPNSQSDQYVHPHGKSVFFLFRFTRGSRALTLLVALFLQIFLQPFNQDFPTLSLLMQLVLIFSAIVMVSDSRPHMLIGLILGLPASMILIFLERHEFGNTTWVAYALILLLYLHVIRLIMIQVFETRKVTLETIGLAMCAYVLLGTLWTLFYIPLAVLNPDAFIFPVADQSTPLQDSLSYFSFVTLTTLGFGDIVPVSPMARSLAILEALTGVLFLAVLISRLVGSYNSDRRR